MKKRFIAGAICPKCKALDRIVMYREDNRDVRECVECGFSDTIHIQPLQREIETRVNVSEASRESETEVVKILGDEKGGEA